ncbi:class I SAM-dependent methyltransferase, partial [bacterium]|nr:class I SAM-dependent methyltransferase [bacterium]
MWSEFLLSPKVTEILEFWRDRELTPSEEFSLLKKLRQNFTLQEASLLIKQIQLRHRAKDKFPQADKMFFADKALEQSTSWPLAWHRAQKLHEIAPPGPILDLGCGLGGDALAMAQFREVIAIDCDEDRLDLLQANIKSLNPPYSIKLIKADYTSIKLPPA